MFYNNRNTKYYIYFVNEGYVESLNSFEELMFYIIDRGTRYDEFYKKSTNSFIEDINMNFNDIYRYYHFNGIETVEISGTRQYLFYDENYRTIDLRNYEDLIFSNEYYNYLKNKYEKYRYSTRRYRSKKKKSFWKSLCRSKISIVNDKKKYLSSPKEERKYLRNKRKVTISNIDCFYKYNRNVEHSWKRQNKCKKQWQKNIK